ncbi:MAG: J domain-containing protein, partial [Chloroflexales bacterium]|nr:J domain-containing protein [Chloroflexales bacterium]
EGESGPRGGPHGNLYVTLDVQPHEFFVRYGNNELLELRLNVAQAALGTELEVPTVDGNAPLKVPPGTQTGTTFTIRNKGVPFLRQNGRGDQVVVARVVVPDRLNDQQRRLFQELAQSFEGAENTGDGRDGFFGRLKDAFGL